MKRLIAILLLTSLLCGCAATQTPSVPEETKLQIEQEVLPGGVWVQTDYSQYAPQENLETKYTRLSPEFISELQPSDDYGMLYPFVGNLVATDYGAYDVKYGLVDESGRIVVDAVYTHVTPVSYDYEYEGPQLPIWVLEKTVQSALAPRRICAIAGFYGSFVTEPIYSNVYAYEDYILGFYYDEKDRRMVHVFDQNGKLCLDSSAWSIFAQDQNSAVNTSGGFFGVISYGSDRFEVSLTDGTYYLDWDGNIVCGPYVYGNCFIDGYAEIAKENYRYAFIDPDGNEMWDTEFSYVQDFQHGFARGETVSGEQALISATDGIVLRCEGYSTSLAGSVFTVFSDSGYRCYSLNGDLIYEASSSQYCEIYGDGKFLFDYEASTIRNLQTGKEWSIDNSEISWVDYYKELSRLCCFTYGKDFCYYVLDEDFNILRQSDRCMEFIEDPLTQKAYIYIGEEVPSICNAQLEVLFKKSGTNWSVFNDRIIGYDDLASYHYDMQDNLLFCYRYPIGIGD